jgi:hypothetical protein
MHLPPLTPASPKKVLHAGKTGRGFRRGRDMRATIVGTRLKTNSASRQTARPD